MTIYVINTEDLDMHNKALIEEVISGNNFLEINEEDLKFLENIKRGRL